MSEKLPPLPSTTASDEGEARYSQLLDEKDHMRCTEGNKAALLAEKLDKLRALKDDLIEDDWKFVPNVNGNSYSGSMSR